MRYLVLVIAVCGVASAALWARLGLDRGFDPLALSAWRLTLASVALWIWRVAWERGRLAAIHRKEPEVASNFVALAVAGLFLGLHFATWIASLEYVSVARSTLLVATSPLWAGLAGLFVASLRPKPFFWLGLALAGAGTWLVTSQGISTGHLGKAWIGDLLAVVGAICIVPYLLLSQKAQKNRGTIETITWIYSAAAVGLWVACLAMGRVQAPNSPQTWASIVGMAVFAQLIGHSLFNLSLKNFSAAQVAASTLLEPIFAALLAWPILGEALGGWQALGGVVLLVGVGLALK